MANYCSYRVIVKGKKNSCYALYGSMPVYEYASILSVDDSDEACTLRFEGNCKRGVDYDCDSWKGPTPVTLPEDHTEAYKKASNEYSCLTLQDRSKMFDVEVWCYSWDENGGRSCSDLEHYIKGSPVNEVCPTEMADDAKWTVINKLA